MLNLGVFIRLANTRHGSTILRMRNKSNVRMLVLATLIVCKPGRSSLPPCPRLTTLKALSGRVAVLISKLSIETVFPLARSLYTPLHRMNLSREHWRTKMISKALFVRLEAKPGKEQAVEDFLTAGLE